MMSMTLFTVLDAHGVYEQSEHLEPLLIRQASILSRQ